MRCYRCPGSRGDREGGFTNRCAHARAARDHGIERDVVRRKSAVEQRKAETTKRLEQRTAEQGEAIASLQAKLDTAREEGIKLEQRSAEQFSASTKLWGQEIAIARDKIAELEKALRAEKLTKDDEVKAVRRVMADAIAQQLKELAMSVGGVNHVHNAHMGSLRSQLEETITRLDQLTSLLANAPPPTITHAALGSRSGKQGRR